MNKRFILPLAEDVEKVLKLSVTEVPSFPPVMAKLLELCNDDEVPMEDLAKLVETDPGISTRILRVVNSAFYGLVRNITSVNEGMLYLGTDEVKRIALKATVFEKMIKPGRIKGFDRTFFWRHCLCVASLARAIAEEVRYPKLEEAYVAGLLHDFGKILFDLQGCVNYGDFIRNAAVCAGPMIDEERDFMGMGHDDIGAFYSLAWNLPESLTLAINLHHRLFSHLDLTREEMQLISLVSLANFLSWTQGMGSSDINHPPILQPEVEDQIPFTAIDFQAVIKKMDREMEQTAQFYNFVFPSSTQFRENLLQANLRLGSINSKTHFARTGLSSPLPSAMTSLTVPHHSLDPEKIIRETLRAIYDDFRFDRIYFLRPAMPLRRLGVSRCLENGIPASDMMSVQFDLDQSAGGFIRCLRHKEPVLIQDTSPGEKKILTAFHTHEMLVVPFCSRNKVIGILGMDHAHSKKPIDPGIVSTIAIVATELGMALENAAAFSEAKSISRRDGLTGLLNRSAMDTILEKAFQKAAKEKNQLSLVMVDVDYFKKFNDTFGHPAGDTVLKLIARTLKKMSRPSDHPGRYGGEEFIIVLEDTGLDRAKIYAERIRREIERLGALLSQRFPGLRLTVSAGVSHLDPAIKNAQALILAADKALYQAKESGRNRVVAH